MGLVDKYLEEIDTIRELIKPIVDECYPSKANREVIGWSSGSPAFQWGYKARIHPFH